MITSGQVAHILSVFGRQSALPPIEGRDEAAASVLISLYRYFGVTNADGEFGLTRADLVRRGREVFARMEADALSSAVGLRTARLLGQMYALSAELFADGRAPLHESCGAVLSRLLAQAYDAVSGSDGYLRAALCGCLVSALSTSPSAAGLRPFVDGTLGGWVHALRTDGSWPSVPADLALERVIVLNRRSFLLGDTRADAPAALAYARCRRASLSSALTPALAARLYTAARLGNAYPVDPAAIRTCLSFFEGELSRAEAGSTAWLVAAAHVVDGWCEEMAEMVGEEWKVAEYES